MTSLRAAGVAFCFVCCNCQLRVQHAACIDENRKAARSTHSAKCCFLSGRSGHPGASANLRLSQPNGTGGVGSVGMAVCASQDEPESSIVDVGSMVDMWTKWVVGVSSIETRNCLPMYMDSRPTQVTRRQTWARRCRSSEPAWKKWHGTRPGTEGGRHTSLTIGSVLLRRLSSKEEVHLAPESRGGRRALVRRFALVLMLSAPKGIEPLSPP